MEAVPPIRLVVSDDLRRDRLTVFFRPLLALPHLTWLALWAFAATFVAFLFWIVVLIDREAPEGLCRFLSAFLRYSLHVSAYVLLATNAFPGFLGRPGYPIDVEIDPPELQSRWSVGFRFVLVVPAILLGAALGNWWTWTAAGVGYFVVITLAFGGGVATLTAVLAWFAALVTGRAPRGLRDLTAYALGHGVWTGGYAMLLTGRYPSPDPRLAEDYAELPDHPVRIAIADDLERSRLTVIFRLLLALPHFVWLMLWSVAAFFAVLAAWFAALATGRVPTPLHRFLAAYVRYTAHVLAFLHLVGRRFPGFAGREGSYGIDILIAPPAPQRRWKTFLRLFLVLPALLLQASLAGVLFVIGLLGWWYALFRGRMPEGLRNVGAACLRYGAQTSAYLLLVSDRYPFAGPTLQERDVA